MLFQPTTLQDAYIIEPERREDDRGFFARIWCAEEFQAEGISTRLAQANLSWNRKRGTLRGMHYQVAPYSEVKLVRCTRGAIHDVIIDLRPESPTYLQHEGFLLTQDNYLALYVPEGFAHGFQTMEDDTEVTYQVSAFYTPGAERGIRYDDLAFSIRWPLDVQVISPKDMSWPSFAPEFTRMEQS